MRRINHASPGAAAAAIALLATAVAGTLSPVAAVAVDGTAGIIAPAALAAGPSAGQQDPAVERPGPTAERSRPAAVSGPAAGQSRPAAVSGPAAGQSRPASVSGISTGREAHPDDIYWDEGFIYSDLNGSVQALAVKGDSIFVGGSFTTADGIPVYGIAMWSGGVWSALGSGVWNDDEWLTHVVDDILIVGNMIYICGRFTHAGGRAVNNIARWNGTRWLPLGSGLYSANQGTSRVHALALHAGDVYAAGNFSMAGNIQARSVARWDGTNWHALGNGTGARLYSMTVWKNHIFCAGWSPELLEWDGSEWSVHYLDIEWRKSIFAMAGNDTALYLGGDFEFDDGVWRMTGLVAFDGESWRHPHRYSDVDGIVYALAFQDGDLYVGGDFEYAGGVSVNNIRRWDGEIWHRLGHTADNGTNGPVYVLAGSDTGVVAAGIFTEAGGTACNKIALWDGSGWITVKRGTNNSVNGPVRSIAALPRGICVAGDFTAAGDVSALNIAAWDGSEWRQLGSGIDDTWRPTSGVRSVCASGNTIYAGGSFLYAGNLRARSLASWDGTEWQEWGGGATMVDPYVGEREGEVFALLTHGENIYAAGYFHALGLVQCIHIGKWNGEEWSPLDGTISAPYDTGVRSLAPYGDGVVVGGRFNGTTGTTAYNIAGYSGGEWFQFGDGVDGWVWAVASDGTTVYAGGEFESASGAWALNVARWDGSAWHQLGAGLNGIVNALAVLNGDLYATGLFTASGATPLSYIARWDGVEWHPLGSGLDQPGNALTVRGHMLYVGGEFNAAGSKPASFLSRWIPPGTVAIERFSAVYADEAVALDWEIYANTGFAGFIVNRTDLETGETVSPHAGRVLAPSERSCVDRDVRAGHDYEYVLALVKSDDGMIFSGSVRVSVPVPPFTLLQNYPNPFRQSTTIEFTLPWENHAVLRVFDVEGRIVATLESRILAPGRRFAEWDGRNDAGSPVSSGVYFYRLNAGGRELTRKLMLIR